MTTNVSPVLREFFLSTGNRGIDETSMLARIYQHEGLANYCTWLRGIGTREKAVVLLEQLIPAEDEVIATLVAKLPSGIASNNHAKLKEAGLLHQFIHHMTEFSGKIVSANSYNDGKYVVIESLRTDHDGVESTVFYGNDSYVIWDSWEKAMLSQMFDDLVLPAVNRLLPQD
jgi:hypothetical protein